MHHYNIYDGYNPVLKACNNDILRLSRYLTKLNKKIKIHQFNHNASKNIPCFLFKLVTLENFLQCQQKKKKVATICIRQLISIALCYAQFKT